MTDQPSPTPAVEPIDAYSLLSKPTLEVTDAEVLLVIEDLRLRRTRFLATAKPDNPKAERKKAAKPATAAKKTEAERKAVAAELFANLNLDLKL